MSKFLEDLKNAADNGEFNSDAAKKINEIDELAEKKASEMGEDELQESLEKRAQETPAVAVTEEEALELNSQYEEKMEALKTLDAENKKIALAETAKNQLKTLIEIEDMVKLTIQDMMFHIESLEENFKEEFMSEISEFGELSQKMEAIQTKYRF